LENTALTTPGGSIGAQRIVSRANQVYAADPNRPLVVIAGGPLTTVAEAYLLDNSIENKVIVVWLGGAINGSNGYNNWADGWAHYITLQKFILVQFPEIFVGPQISEAQLSQLSPNLEPLRQWMIDKYHPTSTLPPPNGHDADAPPAISLMRNDYVTGLKRVSFDRFVQTSGHQVPVTRDDPSGTDFVITDVDEAVEPLEWWRPFTCLVGNEHWTCRDTTEPQVYYVSPSGYGEAYGSATDPLDLATVFRPNSMIRPGDTVWLKGGRYVGDFDSYLNGERDKPIVLRAAPGENVIIDGSIYVYGDWTTYWGLEVMNASGWARTSLQPGTPTNPPIASRQGFEVFNEGNAFINNIVHDTFQGFGVWKEAKETLLYGNIVFNNGWVGPDRGHGHGIYSQNDVMNGTKTFEDNVVFGNFSGYGFHIYGTSNTSLTGYNLKGNIEFSPEMLIGGGTPANQVALQDNHIAAHAMFGSFEPNQSITLDGNYFTGGLSLTNWQSIMIFLPVRCIASASGGP
jgi:hypothetical protein